MRRTIRLDEYSTFYRNLKFSGMITSIQRHFEMEDGNKYIITITEGSKYRFVKPYKKIFHIIEISKIEGQERYGAEAGSIGGMCIDAFESIFFTLDYNKTYDITVKKVKK